MKKHLFIRTLVLMAGIAMAPHQTFAQSGACASGASIGYNQYVNYTGTAAGDQSITAAGKMEIGPAGVYTIYGAVINNGIVTVQAGGVLNVYGDFINNAVLNVAPGGTVNFYGQTWTNGVTASVTDNTGAANTTPGGAVNFIAARPAVSASFLAASPCLAAYSGGSFPQSIDGGNVPMDIALHVQNAHNINLINSNTQIEGTVAFDVADGDISLGNNNLVFTANGSWTTNVAPDQAFILTDGTVSCAGAVEKLGLAPGASFVYPVGRAETYSGGRDFTPAIIRNDGAVADNFQVRVKSYAEAVAQGVIIQAPQEGMDRIWQITSTNGSGVTMNLQHNSSTNGSDYSTVFGGDANGFVTQYQGAGAWDVSTPGSSIVGTVSGSAVHARGFSMTTTATSCTQPQAWFTKTNDAITPLPVVLEYFNGTAHDCDAVLSWKTNREENFDHFNVQYSKDGVAYTTIGRVAGNGQEAGSVYSYRYRQPDNKGLYRLQMTDRDGQSTLSSTIVTVHTACSPEYAISLYPNPAEDKAYISGSVNGDHIIVYDIAGRRLTDKTASGAPAETIDCSGFAAGTYQVLIWRGNQKMFSAKMVKR